MVFTTTEVTISSTYLDKYNNDGFWSGTYSYDLNGNIINVSNGELEFEVMNSESMLNNEGVLELRLNDGNGDMPVSGTYMFN